MAAELQTARCLSPNSILDCDGIDLCVIAQINLHVLRIVAKAAPVGLEVQRPIAKNLWVVCRQRNARRASGVEAVNAAFLLAASQATNLAAELAAFSGWHEDTLYIGPYTISGARTRPQGFARLETSSSHTTTWYFIRKRRQSYPPASRASSRCPPKSKPLCTPVELMPFEPFFLTRNHRGHAVAAGSAGCLDGANCRAD